MTVHAGDLTLSQTVWADNKCLGNALCGSGKMTRIEPESLSSDFLVSQGFRSLLQEVYPAHDQKAHNIFCR